MSFFYFNGYYSYEMGLIVEEKSIWSGPQPDFELISVPGRDGDVIIDHNRFKNMEVSYTVSFIGTREKASALRQWLCARAVYGYLSDSYQPEYFRYAVFVSQLNIEEVMHNVGRAVLTFSCKPYLYRKDGAMATKYTQSDFVLTNPEQYRSVPDITVYGTGNIYLNIGYNQYYMEDIRSQIILDGELMHAYSGTTPLNEKIRFTEFPYLRPATTKSRGAAPAPCALSTLRRIGGRCDEPEFVHFFVVLNSLLRHLFLSLRIIACQTSSQIPQLFFPAALKIPSGFIPAFSITRPDFGLFISWLAATRLSPTTSKR